MTWFYLSYADKVFRGAIYIKAGSAKQAAELVRSRGLSPGGEVMIFEMSPEAMDKTVPEEARNVMLSEVDIKRLWPEVKKLRELSPKERKRAYSLADIICPKCEQGLPHVH